MTLPAGWELDDDGFPRPVRKRATRLSDLEVDEVSFVERGANQRSHVVLWKEDTSGPEKDNGVLIDHDPNPKRVQQLPTMPVPERVSNRFVAGRTDHAGRPLESTELTKEQVIAKAVTEYPEAYDRFYGRPASSSGGRELQGAALVLQSIAKTDNPAAIARMLDRDPGLYDTLLERR
jgi:hypothetical protein